MKPVIIYPPTVDWDYLHQRPQQLLKALAGCGCLSIFCNLNVSGKHPAGFETFSENMLLANHVDLNSVVDWAKSNYPGHPTIIYFTSPLQAREVYSVHADLVVFDSIDEPVHEFSHWLPDYDYAVKNADLVIASAISLASRAGLCRNEEVFLIPNGCEYEHFRLAQTKQPLDEFPFNTGKPILGYIGSIATWLDWDLIKALSHTLKDYELVLIGSLCQVGKPPVQAPNIHYLGHKDYRDLPLYLSNFSLCLIPLQINDMTVGVNPIKFWEYLASGIPIVSTPLPEVDQDYVITVDRTNLADLITGKSQRTREERIGLAMTNSWHSRAQKLTEILFRKIK